MTWFGSGMTSSRYFSMGGARRQDAPSGRGRQGRYGRRSTGSRRTTRWACRNFTQRTILQPMGTPWSIDPLGSFPGEKTDWRDNPAAGAGPPPSGTWPVRIRLDRVAHRPVFLRISRWRLDRVFVGLRVGDRRLFRFGGLRTRGRDGLFRHAKESRTQRIGSAIPPR